MATRTEDCVIIASIIKREIQKRKKQKKPKDELINCIPISNASAEDETELILLKKKKKEDKKKVQNNKNLKNDKSILTIRTLHTEICDDDDKHLNINKTGYSNLSKDEFTKKIPIANTSEVDSLFKKKKKKNKRDKKMVQNYENMNNHKGTLKVDKFYNETCDDKHLYQDETMGYNFNKDEFTRSIPITNDSEGDLLLKKKKKKKKRDIIMVQNDENMNNDILTLKVEKFYNETCDDNDKHLYKDKIFDSNLNKDEFTRRIPIANVSEGDSLFKKKKKKKNGDKKMVQKDKCLKNDKATLKVEQFCNETCDDNVKYLNKINISASNLNKDHLTTSIQITNASEDDEELTLLKSPLKKSKKKKEKSKMAIKDDTESSKCESLQKYLKNMEDLKKYISEEKSNENHNDPVMINTPYNSRILKVHEEVNPDLFQKLFKNKKKDKKKSIKAVTLNEVMSQKESNKRKRRATDKEYSKNDSPQSVDINVETYYDSNNYIGEDCGKKLELFHSRDDHTSEYQNMTDMVRYEKSLKCNVCMKTFIRKYDLCVHKRTHTGEKPYACNVCGRSFSNSGNLTRHKRTHTGEKPYSCNVCDQSFSQKGNLVIHRRTHTGEKPYACNFCDLSFSQKGNLVIHKVMHAGEEPYACDVCGNSFSRKEHLVRHTRTHDGEKPYACNICGNSFSRKEHLVIHERTHTGEKPYACNVCDQAFPQKGSLVTHKRTHTGEKPYSCSICDQLFSQKGNLVIHRRTHTGEKPYACNVCSRSFLQQGHLIKHSKLHTNEKPFECDQSEKDYKKF